jgi:hypothetical protein
MAVVSLLNHPTLSNADRVKKLVRQSVQDMDEHINLLRLAADSAATGEAEETLIQSLYFLHGKLRRECDKLFTLM